MSDIKVVEWMEQVSDEQYRGNYKDIEMSEKPRHNHSLKDGLSRSSEITITVTGRKSGRAISIPIWFASDEEKLYLLPVQGSNTQWYKNVLQKPSIRVDARGAEADVKAVPVTDKAGVSAVVEKFRAKYGAGDIKKYYSRLDVAVVAEIP
jgi:deazaflavin-dependent oxidoreductase (nitroreductase family)